MASKKKIIVIQGGQPGAITTESLDGEEMNTTISVTYNDQVVSDATIDAALTAAAAACTG